MQKRYPHFLRAVKGDSYPPRVVALVACSTDAPVPGRSTAVRESLASWTACGAVLSAGAVTRTWSDNGCDQASLWACVNWTCKQPGTTWIVSYQAARTWSLLGVWERVESGVIDLVGRDADGEQSGHQGGGLPGVSGGIPGDGDTSGRSADSDVRGMRLPGTVPLQRQADVRSRVAGRGGYAILEDPPSVIDARMPGLPGRIRIVDTANYGLPAPPEQSSPGQQSAWILGAILRMIRCLRDNGWGSLQSTAGGQALHTFKRRFLDHAISCHTIPDALRLEGESYVGGRCECRRIGSIAGPVYQLDFRSLYPSVCVATDLPSLCDGYRDGGPEPSALAEGSQTLLIGDVQIVSAEPAYPCRRPGKIIWPGGTWRATLAGPELLDALHLGRVVHWYGHSRYRGSQCLSRYMTEVYHVLESRRNEGDSPLAGWLKRILVCLAGKFGQRGSSWEPDPRASALAPWAQWVHALPDGEMVRYRSLGWQCQREVKAPWSADACPAIAAWVTSLGRMRLLNAIRCAGWENVYYHDTDSLMVSQHGMDRLCSADWVRNDCLGYLRIVGQYSKVDLRGIKHYVADNQIVCSGNPAGTHEATAGAGNYWYRDRLSGAIGRGVKPEAIRQLKPYSRSGRYHHGVVMDDGIVQPFWLEE